MGTTDGTGVGLTMLNVMGGADIEASLAQHQAWGMSHADLKDAIWGKDLASLSVEEAETLKGLLDKYGISTYCLSTNVFFGNALGGEEEFRVKEIATLDHILTLAPILQPTFVRLLAAQTERKADVANAVEWTIEQAPYMIPAYQEAIDHINDAGFKATIENEAWMCLTSTPDEFRTFYDAIDRKVGMQLTWDIQNQWATGTFPTLEGYEQMKDMFGYCHVKGGKFEGDSDKLVWNVALEEADWPVVEITQKIIDDGVSPILCLNPPSHGKPIEGYDYSSVTKRDIDFLRANITGLV